MAAFTLGSFKKRRNVTGSSLKVLTLSKFAEHPLGTGKHCLTRLVSGRMWLDRSEGLESLCVGVIQIPTALTDHSPIQVVFSNFGRLRRVIAGLG